MTVSWTKTKISVAVALTVGGLGVGAVSAGDDFGAKVEHLLNAQSEKLFGIEIPLDESFDEHVPRESGQSADDLVALAHGLSATILTREAGNKADMFAFWPTEEAPTHTIWCIEGGREVIGTLPGGDDKYNPSVQAIDMSGNATTLLRGMDRCDGIRLTAWGTILATEETDDGQAYEIIDPLAVDATVTDRAAGTVIGTSQENVVKRDALPTISWEGLTVLGSGVVIGGDELRPGSGTLDSDGGAIFKFVPGDNANPFGQISGLDDSPLTDGDVYAMQVSCRERTHDNFPQYGQGCEIGEAAWVKVEAPTARADANANGATGYYRPEDLHKDPVYDGDGVRFCWTNTGREGAQNYGEVLCAVDETPMPAAPDETEACIEVGEVDDQIVWGLRGDEVMYLYDAAENVDKTCGGVGDRINLSVVVANRFVEGDTDFNSVDNLAFQPVTGNVYVIEDHKNGDVFACLPDGEDRDIKTDGCVKVLSVKDRSAEPTGFGFNADGTVAYMAVQHSKDSYCTEGSDCEDKDDYGTDDILVITGFKVKED